MCLLNKGIIETDYRYNHRGGSGGGGMQGTCTYANLSYYVLECLEPRADYNKM